MHINTRNAKRRVMFRNQVRFLRAFAKTGTAIKASEASGVDKSSHYHWLKRKDKVGDEYRRLLAIALRDFSELLEARMNERAENGWEEEVYYKGSKCGTKRKYCTSLQKFMLSHSNPEKYGKKEQIEITGLDGAPVEIISTVRQSLLEDPEYLEFLRQQSCKSNGNASLLRTNGEQRQMGNGSALAVLGPRVNGYRIRSKSTPDSGDAPATREE